MKKQVASVPMLVVIKNGKIRILLLGTGRWSRLGRCWNT